MAMQTTCTGIILFILSFSCFSFCPFFIYVCYTSKTGEYFQLQFYVQNFTIFSQTEKSKKQPGSVTFSFETGTLYSSSKHKEEITYSC